MEPNTIEESIKGLLEAIKESPEYLEFQKQSDILKKKPELKARVDTFRADNYKVQNECDSDNLFAVSIRKHLSLHLLCCSLSAEVCDKRDDSR